MFASADAVQTLSNIRSTQYIDSQPRILFFYRAKIKNNSFEAFNREIVVFYQDNASIKSKNGYNCTLQMYILYSVTPPRVTSSERKTI